MEIVWTVTIETGTDDDANAIAEEAEAVRLAVEEFVIRSFRRVIGDDGSCEAAVRIEP